MTAFDPFASARLAQLRQAFTRLARAADLDEVRRVMADATVSQIPFTDDDELSGDAGSDRRSPKLAAALVRMKRLRTQSVAAARDDAQRALDQLETDDAVDELEHGRRVLSLNDVVGDYAYRTLSALSGRVQRQIVAEFAAGGVFAPADDDLRALFDAHGLAPAEVSPVPLRLQ